ncbi:MAG: potassium-transporting ATPase subunit KdpA [Candidatus Rokuibacteriota bacterium]|nr:MAG: potassium-transporting ATPase subunit KdpA [Candidatus Rokubacteria bacterium]PYO06409.1 MAG: potassium-transporting ATPase subunit KdpA [Candidatus Rokubacteria bacterium]
MTGNGVLQLAFYTIVLLALAKPLGAYMARVYDGRPIGLDRALGWLERLVYRGSGVTAELEMGWKTYALTMLLFNLAGVLAVYALQRVQGVLPLNPAALGAVSPDSSFNTAVSFATNTNWQGYGAETTMSYLTQMLALTVQNFVSAASGMAVAVALIRGFARRSAETIGNFWVDLTRTTLYILLPLSFVLALVLVSQGVVQTFGPYAKVAVVQPTAYDEPVTDKDGKPVLDEKGQPKTKKSTLTDQVIAVGPAASQIAIKQLGTNGGGFFNVNSAHPFENPTPLSNFLELLAILEISAALCYTFGLMVGDTRQGWAVLTAMTVVFVALLVVCVMAEQHGSVFVKQGVDHTASSLQSGGNMEGKEVRFGIANSALWATATTSASNGSVNAMHDSFTPIGGLVPMWLIQLGEVIYGGVGSGLYGMLMFAIIAVFVAGLMVGRTPEYLGKKIEAYEMKMSSLVILVTPALVLIGTSVGVVTAAGKAGIANPGIHGFSEILYAFSSASNNNGSAFAGLSTNTPFYNIALGLCMLFGRYWLAVPVLAIAGALARKKIVPVGAGTLPTHTPLFVGLLVGVVLLVGALTFVPALALGPIVEHLTW